MKTTEQNVLKFIDRHKLIDENDKLLVAFSGGPDSIFALNFLQKYKSLLKIEIGACHINHQLRGKESDNDQKFCEKYCAKNEIRFFTASVNVTQIAKEKSQSVEEAAREVRYKEFCKISEEFGYNKIITAHNMSDNSETVLFNLFKGTGIKGLRGIPVNRENIIRPFLCLTKEEILSYLKLNNSEYCVDKSNDDQKFKRNFLRNNIVPKIKNEINPNFEEAILRNSELISNSMNVLERLVENEFKKIVSEDEGLFDIYISSDYDEYLFGEVVKRSIEKYLGIEVTFSDIYQISKLIKGNPGSKLELKNDFLVLRDRKKIIFTKKSFESDSDITFRVNEEIEFKGNKLVIEEVQDRNNLKFSDEYELISADNLKELFILRKWKNGDKFIPLGMSNFKTVSDFLTDQKYSSVSKREQFVLENDGNIVALINNRLDDRYKIIDKTKRVFKLWITKIKMTKM